MLRQFKGMKLKLLLALFVLFSQVSFGQELKQFLQSCGYGTLAGAGLGLASLVFEKKPNESFGNIARGSSLGLYGGIAYGIFMINQQGKPAKDDVVINEKRIQYFFIPSLDGNLETRIVYRF